MIQQYQRWLGMNVWVKLQPASQVLTTLVIKHTNIIEIVLLVYGYHQTTNTKSFQRCNTPTKRDPNLWQTKHNNLNIPK